MTGMNMYMFSFTITVKSVSVLYKKNCDTRYMILNHVYVKQEKKTMKHASLINIMFK